MEARANAKTLFAWELDLFMPRHCGIEVDLGSKLGPQGFNFVMFLPSYLYHMTANITTDY